jgi:hypothetical protein
MTVLNAHLPFAPWTDPRTRRLPGIQPLDPADWLRVADSYPGQMAERDRLISDHPDAVHALDPAALPAARELLATILPRLPALGFRIVGNEATRPDGVTVSVDPDRPLLTLGRLIQEDLCLLEKRGDEHVLTGAILCFPASWTLSEKFLRPLIRIHEPVASYDTDMARRVQRLFDLIHPDRPMWRANALLYEDPILHHPKTEAARRPPARPDAAYIRSERQCLMRLPETGAVVFSIHTYLIHRDALTPDQAAAMAAHPLGHAPAL